MCEIIDERMSPAECHKILDRIDDSAHFNTRPGDKELRDLARVVRSLLPARKETFDIRKQDEFTAKEIYQDHEPLEPWLHEIFPEVVGEVFPSAQILLAQYCNRDRTSRYHAIFWLRLLLDKVTWHKNFMSELHVRVERPPDQQVSETHFVEILNAEPHIFKKAIILAEWSLSHIREIEEANAAYWQTLDKTT